MKNIKVYIIGLISLIIDIISKIIIVSKLNLNASKVIIKDFFSLTYIKNTGGAWGILKDNVIILIIITIIFLGIFISYFQKNKLSLYEQISYGLALGGILGNLLDRIFRGYVVDFLNFNIMGYNYPVFNLADTFIVVGVLILIIYYIRGIIHERRKAWCLSSK